MSQALPSRLAKRHALGLPAGSVRSLHVLIIVSMICALLLIRVEGRVVPIPPYLLYLLFLGLGHFFAAHGHSIASSGQGHPSPLHLPAGTMRLLIVATLVGVVAWKYFTNPAGLEAQYLASVALISQQPWLPLTVIGGFFLGIVFRMVTGDNKAYWAQDLQAWFSLISGLLLGVAALIHLVIDPGLSERLDLPDWEAFLAAVVAFYFGERS